MMESSGGLTGRSRVCKHSRKVRAPKSKVPGNTRSEKSGERTTENDRLVVRVEVKPFGEIETHLSGQGEKVV